MKWIDIPPVWFAGFVVAGYWLGRVDPFGLSLAGPVTDLLAAAGIGGGLILIALAVWEMRKWRTTVIPHREAGHLVTSGIFKRSRNPIYLGDTLILAGLILRFDAVIALPLVPVFLWLIERRFVLAEEDRLRRRFRTDWARYERDTRRWI